MGGQLFGLLVDRGQIDFDFDRALGEIPAGDVHLGELP
jgi:hypothetical protein